MTVDLSRLRMLLEDTEVSVTRTQGLPSLTDKVFAQRQEIEALRRGLSEAIAEIERLNNLMVDYG